MKNRPQILLTNDDGIESPGLWAAASVLAQIGFVTVAAPRDQFSGAGRSLPSNSDGTIQERKVVVNGQEWRVYAVGGTPAQAVLHSVLEIMPRCPDVVVSGINYGENVGSGVTISGTVGAALEAASLGIPALAVSLETDVAHHLSYSKEVDFSAAAYFTAYFVRWLLKHPLPPDVHVLKVDVPRMATPQTPWRVTRLSHQRYFIPLRPERSDWSQPGAPGYALGWEARRDHVDSDAYTLRVRQEVAVTPLSLDLTSRVGLSELDTQLRRL